MNKLPLGVAAAGATAVLTALAGAPATAAPATAAPATAAPATAAPATAAPAIGSPGAEDLARSGERLIERSVVRDADGTRHIRYDRTYQGLRVVGGDLIVTVRGGGGRGGVIYNGSAAVAPATTTPALSRSAALAAGRARATSHRLRAATTERAELVVYAAGKHPRLAYDVLTRGTRPDQTPSRLHTIVDARTGAVLAAYDEIVNGTGSSQYSGTVTLNTTQSGSTWQLRDSLGNYTTDLNGATSGTGTTFTDADNVWGNGSSSSRQTAGVDAQYGAERTYAYYNSVHTRRGIWNNGTGARSRVHYGNAFVNAFWDGSQMTYGDGTNNTKPLTSLDVAAHEMTHGVTQNTANLTYSGESGGLNEATSDIFATAVEFANNNSADPGDYLIGEKININGNGTPLRYMDQPSKDGRSQDCWTTDTKNLNPHFSSGPLNHWFFMAAEGSGARTVNGVSYNSPTCGGAPAVTGGGRVNIEKVWYRTLATKLTSGSTYAAARNGAITSAIELYGADSQVCRSVAAAFTAIAVPAGSASCGSTPPPPPPPTGNLLQNPGFESGATIWTGTAGPITTNSGRPARTGSWKMWLGGNGSSTTEYEQQTITIPSTAAAPKLSFWVRIDTSESSSATTAYDTMKPQIVSGGVTSTLATYSNLTTTGGVYVQKVFDLSAHKGKTITVKFTMSEDSSLQTSFVVDDTAVTTG